MKTLAPAAKAAIVAGKALVTGAVEIVPLGLVNYTSLGAINVAATSFTGTFAARSTVFTGFSPLDSFQVSKPSVADDPRLTWDAYSLWPSDDATVPVPPVAGQTWSNSFSIYGNSGGADTLLFAPTLDSNFYATEAAAFAALAALMPVAVTGYTTYKVVAPLDPNPTDNRNGLSLLAGHGVPVGDTSPLRVWGGYGPLTIGGNSFAGIGDRGLAQQTAGALGTMAQGMTLQLSGIEPKVLELFDDASALRGASVIVYRLIFANNGRDLLDAHVFDRGRVDTIETDLVVGKTAAIKLMVESAARGLGRSGARQRSDSDQRLIDQLDGYFKSTAFAAEKELYWGGKKPARFG